MPKLALAIGPALITLLMTGTPAFAQEAAPIPMAGEPSNIEIREWTVPWADSRPRDPDVAPNQSIWLVGQGGDYVARFDPQSEEFRQFDLPPGTGPHNIIVDDDARLWIAGNRQGYIGRMNPNTGQLTRFPMPENIKDPHTLILADIDHLWFTAQWSNFIGRMNKKTGAVEAIEVPIPRARPYGIRLDSSGRPWIALLGINALATVDPETFELVVIRTPRDESRLRRIAITSDDAVWYTDYSEGYLGRYDPADSSFMEWKNPSEESGPYAIAADDEDRVWFVETWPNPNQFVGFDLASESFFSVTAVPSGAGAVRHMVFDERTRSIWFGTDTNMLGQARLPGAGIPAPKTTISTPMDSAPAGQATDALPTPP
jgi:virginiamycin B lyase